ncbi:hypothetical protein TanjilG_28624 [Lupinus angustifolius]|uniref:Glycosyltransferase n=1 Tax=Lupinus angustifolius TaxID=3871 RepID=A0A394DG57_LUPAN|nr:PREDICTED: UDP-glycosyltransferase 708D1-like [Lupinus angustifolius]OIW22006.1 hypothetical protein TanjilG_28624 [Lupinus angustifolius]
MTMSDDNGVVHHVAMLPSAGMGHLTPFLRLATFFLNHNIKVTLITPHPTHTPSESQLLSRFQSSFPQVNQINFNVESSLSTQSPNSHIAIPYFQMIDDIRTFAAKALSHLLSSLSPPLSFFVFDYFMLSSVLSITQSLSLPNYVLFTSSASFFALFSYFSTLPSSLSEHETVEIQGIPPIPISSISPYLLAPNSIFKKVFIEDSSQITKFDGFFINTFEALEHQLLEAVNAGKVLPGMPPLLPFGPFVPCEFEKEGDQWRKPLKWLDDQPRGSVVFANFGSTTEFGWDQIREIADGLVRSGIRFLLVVKDKKYFNEDDKKEEAGLEEVLGYELVDRVRDKGLVMKEWVYQSGILSHEAIGGFLSHCGWNSIVEAAWNGVPIFGWPQRGDQKMNAEVVERSGWGTWNKNWGWIGERLVTGEEIGDAIKVFMNNESFKIKASKIKVAARKARSVGGDCEVTLHKLFQK